MKRYQKENCCQFSVKPKKCRRAVTAKCDGCPIMAEALAQTDIGLAWKCGQ